MLYQIFISSARHELSKICATIMPFPQTIVFPSSLPCFRLFHIVNRTATCFVFLSQQLMTRCVMLFKVIKNLLFIMMVSKFLQALWKETNKENRSAKEERENENMYLPRKQPGLGLEFED